MQEAPFFPMELRKTFAENMRRRRLELGWSQEELAFESGLHRTYVSGVERGVRNVSIDNIETIAAALASPAADLLTPVLAGKTKERVKGPRRQRRPEPPV